MAIQLHALAPIAVSVKTPAARPAPLSRPGSKPSPGEAASARTGGSAPSSNFRSLLSRGIAAKEAGSRAARAAATAASAAQAAAPAAAPGPAASAGNSSGAVGAGAAAAPAASGLPAALSDPNAALTAQQVFGANPWVANPYGMGPNGIEFGYNPLYFATAGTAAEVAQMVGGKVVQDNEFTKNTPSDPFSQAQPNEMVELPDGALINPGLIASLYTHGYPNWMVNQAISNEVAGAEASVTPPGA